MRRQARLIAALLCPALVFATHAEALERPIDVEHSSVRIHVGKAGLFSAAGHEHWVVAPVAHGNLDDQEPARIAFSFAARQLAVEPDKDLTPEQQAAVQRTMQDKVLEAETYPDISFRSTSVKKTASAAWSVTGELTLHGQTRPVTATVLNAGDKYVGRCRIKQSSFGIRPVSAGAGLVKVKDELDI